MAISYKITDRSYKYLKSYAWINSNLKLGKIGSRDSREIIRLLENSHYPNIEKCICLINKYGSQSDEIGESILKETDMIIFQRALSELYLFKYLYDKLGNKVKAIRRQDNKKTPDISVKLNEIEFLIEIYSPTDFYAYQIFSKLIVQKLKNLDIDLGFDITTKLESNNFGYATEFPDYKVVLDWIDSYSKTIITWLRTANAGDSIESETPAISAKLSTTLNRKNCDIGNRSISYEEPTRSNDTRHFYETSDPELFLKSQWGVKIKDKLYKKQAGNKSDGVIRVLAINFSFADTSDIEFFYDDNYYENFKSNIIFLCSEDIDNPPYDVVLPCVLDFDCGFIKPIKLTDVNNPEMDNLFSEAYLGKPISKVTQASTIEVNKLFDEILKCYI